MATWTEGQVVDGSLASMPSRPSAPLRPNNFAGQLGLVVIWPKAKTKIIQLQFQFHNKLEGPTKGLLVVVADKCN